MRSERTDRPPASAGDSARRAHGRTVGFVGAKGGVGTTSALLNCAVALARDGRSVIAAELTPWASSFTAQLRQEPSATLADLLATPEHIDRDIERYLVPMPPGVRLLFGSPRPRALTAVDAQPLDRVVHALAVHADTVLVDLPVRLTPEFRLVARHLDHVVLVLQPYATQLGVASETIGRLRALGVGKSRISILPVNRDGDACGLIPPDAMARALGMSLLGAVPAAHDSFGQASERGLPLLLAASGHPAGAAHVLATAELVAAVDHLRLMVALVNADDAKARLVSDLLDDSDPQRFELVRAASLDDVLAEVSHGAFHAVLLFPGGAPEELSRDLNRITTMSEQTAVVVVTPSTDDASVHPCVVGGAQDCIELAHSDTYWLVHSLLAAIERQRLAQRLRAQNRELESCDLSHRRIITQLLREVQHDPRMV